MDGCINLLVFETWLDDQIKVSFNLLADIVNKQDLANKGRILYKLINRSNTNVLEVGQEVSDSSVLESKEKHNRRKVEKKRKKRKDWSVVYVEKIID